MGRKKAKKSIGIIVTILLVVFVGMQVLEITGIIHTPFFMDKVPENILFENVLQGDTIVTKKGTKDSKNTKTYKKYVFVGDSRYVGMQIFGQEEDVFIAKGNMGYSYLIEQLNNIKSECDCDTALIIGLGVNDVNYNSPKYISEINQMSEEMDCQIYYMSVNPVDENVEASYGYSTSNSNIDIFNNQLEEQLSDKIIYIDTNSYLKEMGYETRDGLHYTDDTYKKIYDYIKNTIING